MDTHQAVYDAVRSKISGGDVGDSIRSAIRDVDLGHYVQQATGGIQEAASEYMRPCVMFRPSLSVDGNQWCALYGENLQDGIAGFGDSPSEAMVDFDREYYSKLPEPNPA